MKVNEILKSSTSNLIKEYIKLFSKDCKTGVNAKEQKIMNQIEAELFNRDILTKEDINKIHLF